MIGVLGVMLGGIIAVAGVIQYSRLGENWNDRLHPPLLTVEPGGDIKNKLPYVIQIVVYGLYAVLSLGG